MPIKALIMNPFPQSCVEQIATVPGYDYILSPEPTAEQLAAAEVIIGMPPVSLLKGAPNLKWLQIPFAGTDTYPKAEFPAGAVLTNTSGAFGKGISEYVLTMVLMLYKNMGLYRDSQLLERWQDEGVQLSPTGKNLLIVGAGDIGSETAKLFRPFGCRITGVRRVPRAVPPEYDEMITLDRLDEALPQADIVVCALPGTAATKKLFNAERLALLKKSAVLVNVGRGNLIDCEALAAALNAGALYGAAIDVTDPEPLPQGHPLWKCRNCILTPHITGGSFGHLQHTTDFIVQLCLDNLAAYRDGKELRNLVDFDAGYRKTQG